MDETIHGLNRSNSTQYTIHRIDLCLIELPQDDFLKVQVDYFLADGVEVRLQHGKVQAEVKLLLVVTKGEVFGTDGHLGDVSHCAAFLGGIAT